MDDLFWYDYFRVFIALVAFAAAILSARHAYYNWSKYTDRWKGLWWALMVYNLAVVEGSIEQIVKHIPWGPRTLLGFCAAAACLLAQLRNEGYETKNSEVSNGAPIDNTEKSARSNSEGA
jgi:hypothetical protein